MMARSNQRSAVMLTIVTVLGLVLAFGSQIIVSRQTTKSGPDICVGPAVIGYTCPGSQTQTTRRGFPLAFNVQYKTIKTGGFHFDEATAVPSANSTLSAWRFLLDSIAYAAIALAVMQIFGRLRTGRKQ